MSPRIRTIQQAAAELKQNDKSTAITPYAIRQMVLCGAIPHIKAGNKYLISMEVLENYLKAPLMPQNTPQKTGQIRRVV